MEMKLEEKSTKIDERRGDVRNLIDEKNSLQRTVKALSNEVEQLSVVNEKLLGQLQVKDFYEEYSKVMEELTKLKAGHMTLINMI